MAQAIALPLRAAWIVDSFERGKQRTKRHQGDLYQLQTSLQQIRYRTLRVPTLGRVGSGRRGRTAWPCEDAIQNAVSRASKNLKNLRWFEVLETRGQIQDGKVSHYQVTI